MAAEPVTGTVLPREMSGGVILRTQDENRNAGKGRGAQATRDPRTQQDAL